MDLSSMIGGGSAGGKAPEKEKPPAMEYTAQAASSLISGEVKLTVGEDGMNITTLFDAAKIPYADMTALVFADYTVTVQTTGGDFAFSRMGNWAQPFYDALLDAYNKKVRRALFIAGNPVLKARGGYGYTEGGASANGSAPVEIYDNCACILPPDLKARRIPLCFLTGLDRGDYELTLRVSEDESYTLRKLGYDTAPFVGAVEKQVRSLREKALEAVKEIDPSLTVSQASAIAKLMPEGAAAPLRALTIIAPSFVAAIEEKLNNSRAAETYSTFKELCDPAQIWVGFKKNTASGGKDTDGVPDANPMAGMTGMMGGMAGGNPLAALGGGESSGEMEDELEAVKKDLYMLWMIAPSPGGNACAVEFAGDPGEAAATFIYRFDCGFDIFAERLNRALEAIDFKREVIRMTDEELMSPDKQDYRMAVQRNTALQFVHSCFAGRVIHSGMESWKRRLTELWNTPQVTRETEVKATAVVCPQCGVKQPPGIKFCGGCGVKL